MAPALCGCHCTTSRPVLSGNSRQRLARPAGLALRAPLAHQRQRLTGKGSGSITRCSSQVQTAGRGSQLRFIQHKEEAFVFYRFLSIVYDHIGEHAYNIIHPIALCTTVFAFFKAMMLMMHAPTVLVLCPILIVLLWRSL